MLSKQEILSYAREFMADNSEFWAEQSSSKPLPMIVLNDLMCFCLEKGIRACTDEVMSAIQSLLQEKK